MSEPRPAVVLQGTRYAARLDGDALVLEGRRETHRIPVAAVDRVDLRRGRLDIVLLSAAGDGSGRVYRVAHHNGRAAEAFARTATAALPVADRAERARDGAALVATTAASSGGWRRLFDAGWKVSAWCYLAGLLAPLLAPVDNRPATLVLAGGLWLAGFPTAALGAVALRFVGRELRIGWRLYRRGITVTARVTGHDDDGHDETPSHYARYVFTDADGTKRRHTARDQPGIVDTDTVDICYDPADPDLIRRRRGLGRTLFWGTVLALPLSLLITVVGTVLSGYALALPYLGGGAE